MDTKTINLTQNEIKQLLFGLNARRKRIENRKRNDLKHGKNNKYVVELDTAIYGKGNRLLGGLVNGSDFYKRSYFNPVEIDTDIYDFLNMLNTIFGCIDIIACESIRFLPGYLKFKKEHPDYNFIKRKQAMANKIERFMHNEIKRINGRYIT
jgi:hypothetical protein